MLWGVARNSQKKQPLHFGGRRLILAAEDTAALYSVQRAISIPSSSSPSRRGYDATRLRGPFATERFPKGLSPTLKSHVLQIINNTSRWPNYMCLNLHRRISLEASYSLYESRQ